MARTLAIAVLVIGVILLVLGINAHDSVGSDVKVAVTGTATDRSMWLIVAGLAGIIVGGLVSMFRRNGH